MGFNCGIVGLPNVGKSTLFNALTSTAQAPAENYPFCTIEPNLARVPVPDRRLGELARITRSARVTPTQIEFVDIAGLVRGASRGEGLGNRFLSHIREVDAVAHVLRCFESGDVAHVEGAVDPLRDAEIVETELMLADLESLERRVEPLVKKARGGDKEAKAELALVEPALAALRDGRPARAAVPAAGNGARAFGTLGLITAKPVMYVCNVDEAAAGAGNAHSAAIAEKARVEGAACVVVSAAIESELALIDDAEARAAFLADLGIEAPGLERVIRAGYDLLGLITFFTNGPKETRAWTVRRGAAAIEAAGCIHSDFVRGFIRVEVIAGADYLALGGEQAAKDAGKMRTEGRDYVVRDGDVLHFRFNV
ncbi:MAG: redox-regulated ATPase YchF [Alphaproteobacteria bacterium]